MSDGSKRLPANLPGTIYSKQKHRGELTQYFMNVMTRGRCRYVPLPDDFRENGANVTKWAKEHLYDVVTQMVADKHDYPKKLVTDKGRAWTNEFWTTAFAYGGFQSAFEGDEHRRPGTFHFMAHV